MSRSHHKPEEHPDQGFLIDVVVSPTGLTDPLDQHQATRLGELHPRGAFIQEVDPEPQTEVIAPTVDTRIRAGHLLNSLGFLALTNRSYGFQKKAKGPGRAELEGTLKDPIEGTEVGVRFTKNQAWKRAKQEFLNAYNMGRENPVDSDDYDFSDAFTMFNYKYGVGTSPEDTKRRRTNRDAFRRVLRKIVLVPGELETQTYQLEPDPTVEIPGPQIDSSPEVAGTRTKLEALRDDPRAGFLPKTNNEKNQAYELLDYMDTEKYPGGISTRLREIAIKTKKLKRKQGVPQREITDAVRTATRSVLNEWGDYMDNAHAQHQKLAVLQDLLSQDVNPRLSLSTLAESLGDEMPDYFAVIRYIDVYKKRQSGSDDVTGLTTRQNRSLTRSGKNKVLEDDYTRELLSPQMRDYLDDVSERTTVGEAKRLLPMALADESARRIFWYRALSSVRGEYRQAAEQVLEHSSALGQTAKDAV